MLEEGDGYVRGEGHRAGTGRRQSDASRGGRGVHLMPARKPVKDTKFRFLFEDHPQPMWVCDCETFAFLDVNGAAVAHYGYARDEFLGLKATDLVPEEQVARLENCLVSLARDTQASGAWRYRLKDGRWIDVETAVREIPFAGRRAALAMVTDVSERHVLEDQLRQAQRMEAVGMLAGGIAHDFNNLLTIITGYSQLVMNSLAAYDPNRTAVEQIMKAGERAAALTRQLLAFSRRQVMQPKVLDLNHLVASLGTMLHRLIGEDVDLRLAMGPELGSVNADPGQVEQVIMNLVLNARDAMPRGGVLTIETGNVDLDDQYVRTHLAVRPGPYVLLAVSDNGTGMDADTRASLFQPFFTTKGQGRGTGLGLSIVFGIVKQSGGNIEVYSEPGRGTSVKIYLPRVQQGEGAEPECLGTQTPRGTETILVVEDEDMVRKLVRETLEREGYKLLDAAGPVEAQKIVSSHRGRIDLMITDVIMPKLSGRELAERVLRQRPEMKVLYMSGYTDNAVVASGVLGTEMPFLQKPFTPGMLTGKVRQVLEAGSGEKIQHARN